MFGNSAAITTLQLENKQLRMELEDLKKLVQMLTETAITHQDVTGIVGDAVHEAMQDVDFAAEVESAVENALDRATISVRF